MKLTELQKKFLKFCVEYPKDFERPNTVLNQFKESLRLKRVKRAVQAPLESSETESSESLDLYEEQPAPPKKKRGKKPYHPSTEHIQYVRDGMLAGLTQKKISQKYGITVFKVRKCQAQIRGELK